MGSSPRISVIVPIFNQAKYIQRCLRSLNNQSLLRNEFEIILVNDGSTDELEMAIAPFKSSVVYLRNDVNKGLPYSVNHGIRNARGRYIVRVDADDYVSEKFLDFLYFFFDTNPIADAVSCDYICVNEEGLELDRKSAAIDPIACGIMYKIEHLYEIGLYNEEFLTLEDKEFAFRFQKKFKIANLPVPLYRYRRHPESMTADEVRIKHFKEKLEVTKEKDPD